MGDRRKPADYFLDTLLVLGSLAAVGWTFKHGLAYLSANLDPDHEKKLSESKQAQDHLDHALRRRNAEDEYETGDSSTTKRLILNEYENRVAPEVVAPHDIPIGFDDIGGLDDIIEELKESVIYPLTLPHLYAHAGSLLSAPSGVLLYGPPGCGKTMLAKALARESGASFINLHISTLTEKWYGDSNKLVRAVFTLARKIQPAIIFIDEIDAVLGTRRSGEHEASGMVKAEFMTLWDGLTSSDETGMPSRIVVLGATNRMHDIDEAILRRMPKKFPIQLPGVAQRRKILGLVLKDSKVDADHFNLEYVAQVTAGLSGSAIKEACRDAAMFPVREYLQQHRSSGRPIHAATNPNMVRGIRTDDFFRGKGGGQQILIENHARQLAQEARSQASRSQTSQSRVHTTNSSDEYEDVDDDGNVIPQAQS
ncbi:ATPase family aaa domain-containing protein 1 [Zalerion maritima]|uniref:ATPase family aaa domain-containing protein 1 n=1 Tax=Zalerion maritima TaxID=339359 RepID=A0AAD5RMI4_9PEZI|nr:ATPase family aaa domain-containing protein 1 [Zalerion maritima]